MDYEKKYKLKKTWKNTQILLEYLFIQPYEEFKHSFRTIYKLFTEYTTTLLYIVIITTIVRYVKIGFDSITISLSLFTLIIILYKILLKKDWKKYYEKKYY